MLLRRRWPALSQGEWPQSSPFGKLDPTDAVYGVRMAELSSVELLNKTAGVVGELGARYMLHPETAAIGTAAGYTNGWAWYVLGRGGVLGDVDADVVASAFGFFGSGMIRTMWEAGIGVEGPRAAGRRYAAACAEFGRKRLSGVPELDRFNELVEKVIGSLDVSGMSLLAGRMLQDRYHLGTSGFPFSASCSLALACPS